MAQLVQAAQPKHRLGVAGHCDVPGRQKPPGVDRRVDRAAEPKQAAIAGGPKPAPIAGGPRSATIAGEPRPATIAGEPKPVTIAESAQLANDAEQSQPDRTERDHLANPFVKYNDRHAKHDHQHRVHHQGPHHHQL